MDKDSKVHMNIVYNVKNDKYTVTGNVKPEMYEEIVSDFIRSQMGQGKDKSKPKIRKEYRIGIEVDLSFDTFHVTDNTGNKGMRDGILLNFLKGLESKL